MKQFLFAFFTVALFSCNSKTVSSFTVEGTLKNAGAKTVYLEQNLANSERPLIVDSTQIGNDGSFKLSVTSKEEGIYSLRAGQSQLPFAVLINDAKKIKVDADLSRQSKIYTVTNSPASEKIIEFDTKVSETLKTLSSVVHHHDSLSQIKTDARNQKTIDSFKIADSVNYVAASSGLKNYVVDLANNSSSATLVVYAVTSYQQISDRYGLSGFTQMEVSEIVDKALTKFPGNTALTDWKKTLRPSQAPDFTLTDTSGKQVSLSSFRGKYLLVDFWASWCKPCRMENPNVVAAYNQFKDKNFTILGVSLDNSKQEWLRAIQQDGLTWNHVSDLKGWESDVVNLYGVQGIPYNFLLDPNGNIIAEDVRGQELFNTLSKVLKQLQSIVITDCLLPAFFVFAIKAMLIHVLGNFIPFV